MLFNSLAFVLFLPLVFGVYWFALRGRVRWQNAFVLVASYVFYGWWDERFLLLIFTSSLVDFIAGNQLARASSQRGRKMWLGISLAVNLGMLGFFKYYHFFVDSFIEAFSWIGIALEPSTLQVILPVGISFYTFQTLSYTIDIYRGQLKPTRDPIAFFAFVSFFPQLVAGPIERASSLLPQFFRQRTFSFDFAVSGLRIMLWGLFKKIVVADNLARYVDLVYADPTGYQGLQVILAAVFFTIQVYCDFSGYSDIAIGTARLFGFQLMRNFRTPFFSKTMAEFWNRWHISLNTWFRDYIYIPMGGSRVTTRRRYLNILTIFLISGLWHGASWAFVIWGALNGMYLVYAQATLKWRGSINERIGLHEGTRIKKLNDVFWVFTLFAFGLFIFRSNSIVDAYQLFIRIPDQLSAHLTTATGLTEAVFSLFTSWRELGIMVSSMVILLLGDFCIRHEGINPVMLSLPRWSRWTIYYFVAGWMAVFGAFAKPENFVYFQF